MSGLVATQEKFKNRIVAILYSTPWLVAHLWMLDDQNATYLSSETISTLAEMCY